MKDFETTWSCAEAIQALFFPNLSGQTIEVNEQRILQIISAAFNGLSVTSTALSILQQKVLSQAIHAVKSEMPHLAASDMMQPMLWARWALRLSGLPIANDFWKRLTRWRAGKTQMAIILLQYRDPLRNKWRGKAHAVEGGKKLIGYTPDQFLDHPAFSFDEYAVRWRVKIVPLTPTQPQKVEPRPVANICGEKLMEIFGACIRAEAERSTQNILSTTLRDGKYTCDISPTELLKILKERHHKLNQYSDNTLRRALPTYVRSPRGRPGGPRK